MNIGYRLWLAVLGVLLLAGTALAKPDTGPWDLKELRRAPAYETAASERVQEAFGGKNVPVVLSQVYYAGEPWLGKPTRIFAYYARPAEPVEKKLPAMVLVHGGGGTAFPEWARLWAARGYAALAMDLSGSGPGRQRLADGGPGQGDDTKFRRLKEGVKNAWSYHAVAAVLRGVSLLRALPEVDRDRIGITGISWGGYLTSIAMSLDDRLKLAVPVYGCGFLHENSVWIPILASLPEDERRTWIENFDPSTYLSRCKIPVLWMNGTNDFAYPLDSYQKSYRATRGPRTLCVTVKMPHSHPAGWEREEIYRFADSILRRRDLAPALAAVSLPLAADGKVLVRYRSDSAIRKADLHWTTDLDKPWQQREWQTSRAAVLDLDTVTAELPAGPLVFFLTLTDARGSVVSTEHVERR